MLELIGTVLQVLTLLFDVLHLLLSSLSLPLHLLVNIIYYAANILYLLLSAATSLLILIASPLSYLPALLANLCIFVFGLIINLVWVLLKIIETIMYTLYCLVSLLTNDRFPQPPQAALSLDSQPAAAQPIIYQASPPSNSYFTILSNQTSPNVLDQKHIQISQSALNSDQQFVGSQIWTIFLCIILSITILLVIKLVLNVQRSHRSKHTYSQQKIVNKIVNEKYTKPIQKDTLAYTASKSDMESENSGQKLAKVYKSLVCPINARLIIEPGCLKCGHSFQKKAIAISLAKNPVCPVCRKLNRVNEIFDNFVMKQIIEDFRVTIRQKGRQWTQYNLPMCEYEEVQ